MAGYVGHNVPARDITKSFGQVTDWVPIKHIDCNGAELSTVEFKDGSEGVVFDSTFYEYLWVFDGVQSNAGFLGGGGPADRSWAFQVNASGQSGFNESFTGSGMIGGNNGDLSGSQGSWKSGNSAGFGAASSRQHNATDYTNMAYNSVGAQLQIAAGHGNATDNDKASVCGELRLWHPSDATYYTPYTSTHASENDDCNGYGRYLYAANTCGVISVAAAIDEISFKFTTNEVNGGTISMYGLAY